MISRLLLEQELTPDEVMLGEGQPGQRAAALEIIGAAAMRRSDDESDHRRLAVKASRPAPPLQENEMAKTGTVNVRLPKALISELNEIAKVAGVSVATVLKVMIAIDFRHVRISQSPPESV